MMPHPGKSRDRVPKWLEISPDYQCNNRCVGCFSVQDSGEGMDNRQVVEALVSGRRRGATGLWLGGGEPTLRRDLPKMMLQARKLGYERIKVQTNGMMLGYPNYVRTCVKAGMSEVNFSIKGASAESHDRLTQTPGCFDAMLKGIAAVREAGLPMEGDILVYASNVEELPEMVRFYTELGIGRYNIWLLSAVDAKESAVAHEVPRIGAVMPPLMKAMSLGLSSAPDFITSLHTPPCTIPEGFEACEFFAADLDLLVANPDGYWFWLEESPIEGGHYFERCGGCAARGRCGGVREEYLRIYGGEEFEPLGDGRL